MAGDTQITVVGNLTGDPELRFIQSGAAVVNFTVASTPRTFDRQSNEWKDGDTLFMRCSLWREAAENVAESLTKGMRVIVTGRLVSRSWEANGEKRTVMEMQVDEVGPRSATPPPRSRARSAAAGRRRRLQRRRSGWRLTPAPLPAARPTTRGHRLRPRTSPRSKRDTVAPFLDVRKDSNGKDRHAQAA